MRFDPRDNLRLPLPTLALGLLNLGILSAVVFVAVTGTRADEVLATPARPPAALAVDLAKAPAAPDLAAIQAQPLMHSSRTFHAQPAETVPAAPPLPNYRLAGAFIVPNKPPVALLAAPGGGATRRVKTGDVVDGWNVQAIEARRVVLKWQEQLQEITSAAPAVSAGLKRVPIQRQRVATASGTVTSLGASGARSAESAGYGPGSSDAPRLYRPPPN